jgi:hypothetical protein
MRASLTGMVGDEDLHPVSGSAAPELRLREVRRSAV